MNRSRQPFRSLNIFVPRRKEKISPIGKLIIRTAPTWRYSPVRRIVQVLTLALFLLFFFHVAWPYADTPTGIRFEEKEWVPVESFLWIDPLVGLSTAIAARAWNVALLGLLVIFLICTIFPRGFCGYLCPLGTLIDGFDWLIGRRIGKHRFKKRGGWVHTKFYILAAVFIASVFGVLLSGFVSSIPIATRGLLFTAGRLQLGLMRNWGQVAPADWALYLSIALFAMVFVLSLAGTRFWCRYVCPSGALFSVFNFARLTERKVESSCVDCGKCIEVCPFDAIENDFSTRALECTFCQTCGGACPTRSIKFASRWNADSIKPESTELEPAPPVSRRVFFASAAASTAAACATRWVDAAGVDKASRPIRPPGSVPERQFLDLCIRCGECMQVCPGPVLHPAGIEHGFEGLWTPKAVMTHAGCHPECNHCTLVCPTRAIRPLPLEVKRETHMGLAVVNTKTCLPHAGERICTLCFDECAAAGYNAIEMREIKLEIGEIPPGVFSDEEIEAMSRIEAPFVIADKCVGCGLCEYRCHAAYVTQEAILEESAIVTLAENEDRAT